MSLIWTLIASFLYAEIAVVLLLVLPVASPSRWQRFFRSRFLAMLGRQAQMYFYLLLAVLVVFLIEAVREMRKYSHIDPAQEAHLNVGMQHSMRLFRAQRNFYISGFAIFLVLVIRRLVLLISSQATLQAHSEASIRQAESASAAARSLLSQQKDKKSDGDSDEVTALKEKIAELEKDLKHEKKDKEALKSQSEGLHREFDRLTEEYSKIEKKLNASTKAD
uniref:Endoplasmic reticulum transmembrane protein n=1 Tax=Nyssomyia neivai TaxID=330878 RepID=A0A1L8DJL2_9DIPT